MLHYLLYTNHGYALTEENFSLYEEALPFTVNGAKEKGTLYVGGVACPAVKGMGAIPTSALQQGANSLCYVEGEQRFQLDDLQRCGNIAYVKPMKKREALMLFFSFAQCTREALANLEGRISTAEQQIAGYPLFRQ